MPWIDEVAAVVQVWYPGQEYGDALAALLFGDANPSGKLPTTFPAADAQFPAAAPAQFPGDGTTVRYDEELLVGYRWYDAKKEKPLFPFGHGLSYTTFAYDGFTVAPRRDAKGAPEATAKVKVTNSGTRAGAEVVQLYVGFPAAAGEPPWQLKAFEKVRLEPGQSKDVVLPPAVTRVRVVGRGREGVEDARGRLPARGRQLVAGHPRDRDGAGGALERA